MTQYLWADDPTLPPHAAAIVIDNGSANGLRQSGPLLSASAEGLLVTSAQPVFVDITGQQSLGRQMGVDTLPQPGPAQPALATPHQSGLQSADNVVVVDAARSLARPLPTDVGRQPGTATTNVM